MYSPLLPKNRKAKPSAVTANVLRKLNYDARRSNLLQSESGGFAASERLSL